MRVAGLLAMLLAVVAGHAAPAAAHESDDWYRSAHAWIEQMLGAPQGDDEIILPPAGIDPKMVVEPPRPRGALRVIPPPSRSGR